MILSVLVIIGLVYLGSILYVAIEEFCDENVDAYKDRAIVRYEFAQERQRCLKLMEEYDELKKQQNEQSGIQYGVKRHLQ